MIPSCWLRLNCDCNLVSNCTKLSFSPEGQFSNSGLKTFYAALISKATVAVQNFSRPIKIIRGQHNKAVSAGLSLSK